MTHHAHAILDMMEGQSFTDETLITAIIEKFGPEATFYTCSAQDLSAEEIIAFLKERGKFLTTAEGYTVNTATRCNS